MRIKRKKTRAKTFKQKLDNLSERESVFKDSTIYGTSKYLNHTQLKNETESLSLLNNRLVASKKLGGGGKIMSLGGGKN